MESEEEGREEQTEEESDQSTDGEWDLDFQDHQGESILSMPGQTVESVPEHQVLSSVSLRILGKIGEIAAVLLSSNILQEQDKWCTQKGFDIIFGGQLEQGDKSLPELVSLARRCFHLEMDEVAHRFQYMISVILFRLSIHK